MRWIALGLLFLPSSVEAQFFVSSRCGFGPGCGFGSCGYPLKPVGFGPGPYFWGPQPFFTTTVGFQYTVTINRDRPRFLVLPPMELPNEDRFDDSLPANINLADFIVIRPRRQEINPVVNIQPAPLPLEKPRNPNPLVEYHRQIDLGCEAFGEGSFGQARFRFQEANRLKPEMASGFFSRAQAEFALGKYREAVASLVEGIRLRPEWATTRFQARELYGNRLGLFDLHLQELRNALAKRPDDPALLFLYGYQLWFDGRRDEVKEILAKAIDRTDDPEPIRRFLKADGN
jgi:tetratricopeptide (TPR) repeat protein